MSLPVLASTISHLRSLPAAVWVLLAGVTAGGKWPEPGAGCQGGLHPPQEESRCAGCCHMPRQVPSPCQPLVTLLCLVPSLHGSFSSLCLSCLVFLEKHKAFLT